MTDRIKILVFSDSHRDVESMESVINTENPNMIIHLGDNVADAMRLYELYPQIRFTYVRGNTDFAEELPTENYLMIFDKLIFITHGHRYNVKWTKKEIIQKGIDDNVDLVMFGHTHEPYLMKHNGMTIMNPGSIGRRNIRKTSITYAIVYITKEEIKCEIKNIAHKSQ